MRTNAHIFKKLDFTTTIHEYFAEHYTRINNIVKDNSNWLQTCMKNVVGHEFQLVQVKLCAANIFQFWAFQLIRKKNSNVGVIVGLGLG